MSASDGGAAFPRPISGITEAEACVGLNADAQDGMSLRDYFAGQSLAMLSRLYVEDWEERAYTIADALLARRAK
jgi:hypothetical protein